MNFFNIGPMELILVLVLALIVFGPTKLPEIAKGLGKAVSDFQKASQGLTEGLNRELSASTTPPTEKQPDEPTTSGPGQPPVSQPAQEQSAAPAPESAAAPAPQAGAAPTVQAEPLVAAAVESDASVPAATETEATKPAPESEPGNV